MEGQSESVPSVGSATDALPEVITAFPPEVVVLILRCLNYRDLLTCSLVCRSFHDLIATAPDLVYLIELAAAGIIDSQSNRMSMAESLSVLRDLQARWLSFKPLLRQTILPPSSQGVFSWYSQGLYTQAIKSEDFFFFYTRSIVGYPLPGRTTELLDHGPLVDDMIAALKFRSQKHFVDISKDLIMIFEWVGKEVDEDDEDEDDVVPQTCVRVHFRTLSSGAVLPPPSVPESYLGNGSECNRTYLKSFHIHDDILAMHLSVYTSVLTIIWDWKTGEKLVHIEWQETPFDTYDFSLLSSSEFIVLTCGCRGPWLNKTTLSLFHFGQRATFGMKWTFRGTTIMHIVSLCLPELVPKGYMLYDLSTASHPSDTQRDGPFIASIDIHARIIVLDGCPNHVLIDPHSSSVTFVLHSTTLSSLARRALSIPQSKDQTIFIPWEDWGPKNSRMFLTKPPSAAQYPARYFTGERLALTVCDADGVETAQILDFNPRALKRAPFTDDKDHAATVVTEATTHDLSAVFTSPTSITTSLPYTAVQIPDHEEYSDFILDEHRLLYLKRLTSQDEANQIDVFVF